MICRYGTVLVVVMSISLALQPISAQQSPTALEAPSPYRVALALSSNMAQQKIAEAAADGYRVISVISTEALELISTRQGDKENFPGSGLTIVMKRSGLKQSLDYRLIIVKDAKEFNKAINQLGADGFHLVPSSLQFAWAERKGFDTFLDPEEYSNQEKHGSLVHLALMEKAPADSIKYSYQRVSNASDIEKFAARGYYPVGGSLHARFIVLEAQTPPRSTEPLKVQRARLAKFKPRAEVHPDITVESTDIAKQQPADTPKSDEANTDKTIPELDVTLDHGVLAGKKLLLLNDGVGAFFFTPIIDVLTVSGAPDTPAFYRLLLRNDMASIEKGINEAGAQGLRLFPRIGTAYRVRNRLKGTRVLGVIPSLDAQTTFELQRLMAVMYPGSSGRNYSYRLFSPGSPADLLRELNAAEADGFHFLSLWRGILIVESEHTGASK